MEWGEGGCPKGQRGGGWGWKGKGVPPPAPLLFRDHGCPDCTQSSNPLSAPGHRPGLHATGVGSPYSRLSTDRSLWYRSGPALSDGRAGSGVQKMVTRMPKCHCNADPLLLRPIPLGWRWLQCRDATTYGNGGDPIELWSAVVSLHCTSTETRNVCQ